MLGSVKALLVVLVLATTTFAIARPLCLHYMQPRTFARRRNVWLALTVIGFLSPSYGLYLLIAAIVLLWAGSRDDNPVTLYVFMAFVIPEVRLYLSLPGINQLFDMTQHRLLALTVLIPALLRQADGGRRAGIAFAPAGAAAGRGAWRVEHTIAVGFVLLQALLLVPHETVTTTMRRLVLGGLDVVLVVYAFGRIARHEHIADAMCGFWLACALMAPIAVFEAARTWLLYTGIAQRWGDPNAFAWLFRGSQLRAQAAAGHSINLGYQLAIALGFYLFLRQRMRSRAYDALVYGTFGLAIVLTWSRGAWLTALIVVVVYAACRPRAVRRLATLGVVLACAVALMSATPLQETVLAQLPFVGSASQDTIAYRQLLAEASWRLIKLNPLLGDPFVHVHMEALRQGQGIIDFVNGYLYVTLYNGIVGLALLLGLLLVPLLRAVVACMRSDRTDLDHGPLGASLIGGMVATLFYIATAGYGSTAYLLCGLLGAYAALVPRAAPREQPASLVEPWLEPIR